MADRPTFGRARQASGACGRRGLAPSQAAVALPNTAFGEVPVPFFHGLLEASARTGCSRRASCSAPDPAMADHPNFDSADPSPHRSTQERERSQSTRGPIPEIPTGSGLGKYRILERIRSTPNGVIYKARDSLLDRLVALKQ